ncbi:hypothetical protein BH09ACT8_BH09ACT8_12940 [soil metagenome]
MKPSPSCTGSPPTLSNPRCHNPVPGRLWYAAAAGPGGRSALAFQPGAQRLTEVTGKAQRRQRFRQQQQSFRPRRNPRVRCRSSPISAVDSRTFSSTGPSVGPDVGGSDETTGAVEADIHGSGNDRYGVTYTIKTPPRYGTVEAGETPGIPTSTRRIRVWSSPASSTPSRPSTTAQRRRWPDSPACERVSCMTSPCASVLRNPTPSTRWSPSLTSSLPGFFGRTCKRSWTKSPALVNMTETVKIWRTKPLERLRDDSPQIDWRTEHFRVQTSSPSGSPPSRCGKATSTRPA